MPRTRHGAASPREGAALALSFEDLGTALIDTTFVVLDLETTGLSPDVDRITEVGAVKVRGGEVLGELQTLVHPGRSLPPAITAVTGITDAMLAGAPSIRAVLPTLAEFLRDGVLVAHNASFDVGFLRAAFARERDEPFDPVVVDTARLARRLLRDEGLRDRRLGTLARHLGSRVVPDHRALTDARATVDVLHGLLERAGSYGATTLEDLRDLTRSTSERSYRRVGLVRDAPRTCGTYRFLDARGEVLYVGKATDLRSRLRTYFGQDPRRKIEALVRETAEVTWQPTATLLEAEVTEVRAIATHQPRFNRRSRGPARTVHVALTAERFPRLSVVTAPGRGHRRTLGPFPSRSAATAVVEALQATHPIRTCTGRLRVAQDHPACVLKDLGRCGAPCDGSQDADSYGAVIAGVEGAFDDPGPWLDHLGQRMRELAAEGRFERAAEVRSVRHTAARSVAGLRELDALAAAGTATFARRDGDEVEVVTVRDGRLEATARGPLTHGAAPPGATADPETAAGPAARSPSGGPSERAALVAAAARLAPPPRLDVAEVGPNDLEERRLVADWILRRPGVVLVACDGTYTQPVAGGATLAVVTDESRRTARHTRRDRQLLQRRKVVAREPSAATG